MNAEQRAAVNCLLFVCARPVHASELAELTGMKPEDVERAVEEIREIYARENLGLDIVSIDGKWQLCTRPEYASYIEKAFPSRRKPLSHAALETLSIIAYRQPVTRMEIERIRGVSVESVLQTLLERGLIEEKGRKEVPGKPVLYGTTDEFLRQFNLRSIDELPDLNTGEQHFAKGSDES